jgi:hypothetical protein
MEENQEWVFVEDDGDDGACCSNEVDRFLKSSIFVSYKSVHAVAIGFFTSWGKRCLKNLLDSKAGVAKKIGAGAQLVVIPTAAVAIAAQNPMICVGVVVASVGVSTFFNLKNAAAYEKSPQSFNLENAVENGL